MPIVIDFEQAVGQPHSRRRLVDRNAHVDDSAAFKALIQVVLVLADVFACTASALWAGLYCMPCPVQQTCGRECITTPHPAELQVSHSKLVLMTTLYTTDLTTVFTTQCCNVVSSPQEGRCAHARLSQGAICMNPVRLKMLSGIEPSKAEDAVRY
jgi:hypothetical protein